MASVRKESDAKTLVERGKAFAAVGDHTRAEEYLASGLEAGADPRDVLPLLMDVCVKTGRYRSAIQHGENHLRKHPHDLRTRVMVGALYAAINEAKQARAQLEQVVKSDAADEPDARTKIGGAGGSRDPSGANAVGLQAQAHYLLAVVARDTENDVVEADRHFREYLRMEPNGSHADEAKGALLKQIPPHEGPKAATEGPKPAPEAPAPVPEGPKPAPEAPAPVPEGVKLVPEAPAPAPAAPKAVPAAPKPVPGARPDGGAS